MDIKTYMTAVAARARQYGAREIRFTDAGPLVVDSSGKELSPSLVPGNYPGAGEITAYRDANDGRYELTRGLGWKRADDEIMLNGESYLATSGDGFFRIKPKKNPKTVLEQLADFDPEQIARLRSLYGQHGITIYLKVEGETRGRDIHAAIANELTQVGLPARSSFRRAERWQHDDTEIPDIFQAEPGSWVFETVSGTSLTKDPTDPSTKVLLVEDDRRHRHSGHRPEQPSGQVPQDLIVVLAVNLRQSRPVAEIRFSDAALALTATGSAFPDAPWIEAKARREKRSAAPRAPRTWHQTTSQVEEAYLLQEAPRGYVSSKSLFFHGPILYSEHESQPISAMVTREDGGTAVLTTGGNHYTTHHTGIHSGDPVDYIRVDNLRHIITVGGEKPDDYARRRRRDKAEREHPSRCTVDPAAVHKWLGAIAASGEKAVEEAFKGAPYPTKRKIDAYDAILRSERIRLQFRDILGIDLEPVCDVDTVTARRDEIRHGYDERQAELAAAKAAVAGVPPRP